MVDGIEVERVQLAGTRYVIVREPVFEDLCRRAGMPPSSKKTDSAADLDREALAERLKARRQAAGLTQVELARRAGIRPETLNRIERGKTTPDFATIRKLVIAIEAVEAKPAGARRKTS